MASTDSVRAYVLFLHGKAVAYLCCPVVNGVLLYSYLGYDPKHADLSPGTVLQYLVFESLFEEKRFRAFDFTEGQGEHKSSSARRKPPARISAISRLRSRRGSGSDCTERSTAYRLRPRRCSTSSGSSLA